MRAKNRTSQLVVREVQLLERARGRHEDGLELADVARQREAGLVAVKGDLAPLRLHADELERELACAHRDSLLNSLLVYVWTYTDRKRISKRTR